MIHSQVVNDFVSLNIHKIKSNHAPRNTKLQKLTILTSTDNWTSSKATRCTWLRHSVDYPNTKNNNRNRKIHTLVVNLKETIIERNQLPGTSWKITEITKQFSWRGFVSSINTHWPVLAGHCGSKQGVNNLLRPTPGSNTLQITLCKWLRFLFVSWANAVLQCLVSFWKELVFGKARRYFKWRSLAQEKKNECERERRPILY